MSELDELRLCIQQLRILNVTQRWVLERYRERLTEAAEVNEVLRGCIGEALAFSGKTEWTAVDVQRLQELRSLGNV